MARYVYTHVEYDLMTEAPQRRMTETGQDTENKKNDNRISEWGTTIHKTQKDGIRSVYKYVMYKYK